MAAIALTLSSMQQILLLQNFFRSYPKLAGMTGTASTESAEFSSTYDLAVTVVPTNKVQHCWWLLHGTCAICPHAEVATGVLAACICSRGTFFCLCPPVNPAVAADRHICPISLQPTKREDAKDVVFATEEYKWKAVVQEIRHMHKSGRPVLVGTTSVERSEGLASQLDTAGIQYQVHCAD